MPLQNQPFMQPMDAAGRPYPGALAYYFHSGTTAAAEVYSDAAATTPHPHPVEADAAGRFPDIFTDPAVVYRLVLTSAIGAPINDIDPIGGGFTVNTGDLVNGAVTEAKLGNDAVTQNKLADQAVVNGKLKNMAAKTVKGNGGTGWASPNDLSAADLAHDVLGEVMAGSVHMFAHAAWDPAVFLLCNGQAVSRDSYGRLFGKIGTTFGAGDGTTTFNVPDYRGVFLRGHDHGRGKDPDGNRAYGNNQGDAVQNITGTIGNVTPSTANGSDVVATGAFAGTGSHHATYSGAGADNFEVSFDASRVARTATETRPSNYPADFVIWY